MAQGYVFEEAQELLKQFLSIELGAKQIQRVSEHYDEEVEQQIQVQVRWANSSSAIHEV